MGVSHDHFQLGILSKDDVVGLLEDPFADLGQPSSPSCWALIEHPLGQHDQPYHADLELNLVAGNDMLQQGFCADLYQPHPQFFQDMFVLGLVAEVHVLLAEFYLVFMALIAGWFQTYDASLEVKFKLQVPCQNCSLSIC